MKKKKNGRLARGGEIKRYAKAILKWAGGKYIFIRDIVAYIPPLTNGARYYEPFAGAASLFLSLRPGRARLNDLNIHLIGTYRAIRSDPATVGRYLNALVRKHSKSFYYKVRDSFNRSRSPVRQAARFIYLNKAGFNGVYRVNTKGQFNVPHGKRKKLRGIPCSGDLVEVSKRLRHAQLRAGHFKEAVRDAKRGDFVYLDPPYPPLNGSSYFTHYTKERFSTDDQKEVAKVARELASRGVRVLVTNADTRLIRRLYAGWHFKRVSRPRWVRSGKVKHKVNELIITSYKRGRKRARESFLRH
jgi:DNA adenine methylase